MIRHVDEGVPGGHELLPTQLFVYDCLFAGFCGIDGLEHDPGFGVEEAKGFGCGGERLTGLSASFCGEIPEIHIIHGLDLLIANLSGRCGIRSSTMISSSKSGKVVFSFGSGCGSGSGDDGGDGRGGGGGGRGASSRF